MKSLNNVPIADRYAMTVEEMASYTGIGEKKLYALINAHSRAGFTLRIGTKTLLKREAFTRFLDRTDAL